MKAVETLPDGYREIFSVNLQTDKKAAVLVNLLAFLIMAVLIIPMCFAVPITALFDMERGFGAYCARFAVLLIAIIAYMILHELVHGIAMKSCGTKKINYGFTGLYAFAGSDDYYDKRSYMVIALAPVVVWGIVLAVINALVPKEWFWVSYLIQVFNLSGAAGDFYVTVRFLKFPKDILVKDSGIGMTVYSKEEKA